MASRTAREHRSSLLSQAEACSLHVIPTRNINSFGDVCTSLHCEYNHSTHPTEIYPFSIRLLCSRSQEECGHHRHQVRRQWLLLATRDCDVSIACLNVRAGRSIRFLVYIRTRGYSIYQGLLLACCCFVLTLCTQSPTFVPSHQPCLSNTISLSTQAARNYQYATVQRIIAIQQLSHLPKKPRSSPKALTVPTMPPSTSSAQPQPS